MSGLGKKRARKEDDDKIEDKETYEERYFLNPESVSQHLYCSVCQEVFRDPMRAPCGHTFCNMCITEWLKNSRTCPEDRKSLRKQDMHHDFILENIIGDQQVACPYRCNGCSFIGLLTLLSSHKKSCCFNPGNLPEFLQDSLTEDLKEKDKIDPLADGELPEQGQPSLKMRLFQTEESRKLLCSMFEDKKDKTK